MRILQPDHHIHTKLTAEEIVRVVVHEGRPPVRPLEEAELVPAIPRGARILFGRRVCTVG